MIKRRRTLVPYNWFYSLFQHKTGQKVFLVKKKKERRVDDIWPASLSPLVKLFQDFSENGEEEAHSKDPRLALSSSWL